MAFEIRDGEGSLWKNDNRRPDKQDAHARGQCMIGGQAYWVNAWTNTTNDGTKYQSLKFRLKDEQPGQKATRDRMEEKADESYDAAKARGQDPDDDLPF